MIRTLIKSESSDVEIYRRILDNPNEHGSYETDFFGEAVASSELYTISGAYNDDSTSGTAYIFDNLTSQLLHTLDNPNAYDTTSNDNFGKVVACSNLYSVVGVRFEDDAGGTNSGKTYVFRNDDGSLLHTIDNPNAYNTSASDGFGSSVACTDQYIVVGAPYEDDATAVNSGKVYVFNALTKALIHTLDNPNPDATANASDEFGISVACTNTYIVVGGYQEDDTNSNTGKVYIYDMVAGTLSRTLDNPNDYGTPANDEFGWSVACTDTYAVVGTYQEDDSGGTNSGKVYIFDITDGSLLHTLDNYNMHSTSQDDRFGYSLAVTDDYVVVGAYQEDVNAVSASGIAYVYDISTGGLLYMLEDIDPTENDNFGFAVSCAGPYITVGVRYKDYLGKYNSGIVYQYKIPEEFEAPLIHTLDNPNPYSTSLEDRFGIVISLTDTYTLVGAYLEDDTNTNSGKAYIFSTVTGALLHTLDNPNPYGTSENDYFGWDVACTDTYAVVGAFYEDDASGLNSGKAYIYNISTGALLHTLDNPNPYGSSADDRFGSAIACTDTYVVVGAHLEDDANGTDSGKVYIFNISTGAYLRTLDNPNPHGTSTDNYFGHSVDCTDTYAVVTAFGESDAGGTGSGKVYIFNISTGALLHTLDNPNPYGSSADDRFGYSVSCTDNYVVTSAYLEDEASGANSGKAYIYNISTGALLRTLDNPNSYGTSADDNFGNNVACTDTYTMVGARYEDDIGVTTSGKIYIYSTATGTLLQTLDNPNVYGTSQDDNFGRVIDCTDNYILTGLFTEDDSDGTQSGKAYIYKINPGLTNPIILDNPNVYSTAGFDRFGLGVSCSDSYTVVAATGEDDATDARSGRVYIFDNTSSELLHTLVNPNPHGSATDDNFGYFLSNTNTYTAVSAYLESDAGGIESGKVYIYNTVTGGLLHTLVNPNDYDTSAEDRFGYAVSCSDTHTVVGAPQEDDAGGASSGKAYIYDTVTGGLLHTLDNPDPYGTSVEDQFGQAASCSDTYTVVSAFKEDEPSYTSSGKVYIYNNSTGALLRTLDNPNAFNTAEGDLFGHSVDNTDKYIAVGAYTEDDVGGASSGKVYIFDIVTGNLLHTLDNPNAYGTSTNDKFGVYVSCSDNYTTVATQHEDDAGGIEAGKAYIYSTVNGNLLYTLDNPNTYDTSYNDLFGLRVSCSNTHVVVGAHYEEEPGQEFSGKAYIYNIYDKPN